MLHTSAVQLCEDFFNYVRLKSAVCPLRLHNPKTCLLLRDLTVFVMVQQLWVTIRTFEVLSNQQIVHIWFVWQLLPGCQEYLFPPLSVISSDQEEL